MCVGRSDRAAMWGIENFKERVEDQRECAVTNDSQAFSLTYGEDAPSKGLLMKKFLIEIYGLVKSLVCLACLFLSGFLVISGGIPAMQAGAYFAFSCLLYLASKDDQ